MGTRLPSGEEVLIIRPTGNHGQVLLCSSRLPSVPGALPGSPAFQSRIRTRSGLDGMQLLLSFEKKRFWEKLFPEDLISRRTKEPY